MAAFQAAVDQSVTGYPLQRKNMSTWLIILTGLIYLYISGEQYIMYHNGPMATVYFGYALANAGLWAAVK